MFKMSAEEPEEPIGSAGFWWKMIMSMGLVLLGGAFAGCVQLRHMIHNARGDRTKTYACRLTLGLMGLDELHLRVLATSSDDLKEKRMQIKYCA
jgi:metal transporter CNNM